MIVRMFSTVLFALFQWYCEAVEGQRLWGWLNYFVGTENTNIAKSKLLIKKFKQTSLLHCLSATRHGVEIFLIILSQFFSGKKTRDTG